MHDLDGVDHEHTEVGDSGLLYETDNVTMTTIGVDVGSSTFHLMFSRVHLRRKAENMAARYEVVEHETLWRSGIRLTPYAGRRIDADAVGTFVEQCHKEAGLLPSEVDTGAVILTGAALAQHNARALADQIAAGSGKFVCVSAGHHLESTLAAYGSGATEYSARTGEKLLHIDIGGGTTKLAFIEEGHAQATAALTIGGRQVAWDEQRQIVSLTAGARTIGHLLGLDLKIGMTLSEEDEAHLAEKQAAELVAIANGRPSPLANRLRVTRWLPKGFVPDAVSFSGGVSEYIYGREAGSYGDLGHGLGTSLQAAIASGEIELPVAEPGEGIRATVIGASQCSVQLSGNTVMVSDSGALPIHNVPVVHPNLRAWSSAHPLAPEEMVTAVAQVIERHGLSEREPIALAFRWHGEPTYGPMAAFAHGLQQALLAPSASPAIVLLDADVGQSVGRFFAAEYPVSRPVICLDGLELSPLDYVDVGTMLEPSNTFPVVIKSLLFGAAS